MMSDKPVPFRGAVADVPITEDAVALALTHERGDDIRWCPQHGLWYVWNGTRWERDEAGSVFEMARGICRAFSAKTGKERWGSLRAVSAVERFARTQPDLVASGEAWDADPWLLGTPKGAVDLTTGGHLAPSRARMLTKATAVAPEQGEPESWLRFMRETCGGDADLVGFIRRMCGYALTGDTSEQCLFFCFGPGGNGKSVFINTITGIFGDYVQPAAMDTLTAGADSKHSTDLAMLRGARLVTAVETDEGKAWAEARVKQMTGRDRITARFVNRDNFTYRPAFKLMITGNHRPALTNTDDALRRRFNVVPFVAKPVKPDPDLEDKLVAEWPRILGWMIEGCVEWRTARLSHPAAVITETAEYFDDQDLMAQWLQDYCVVEKGQWEYGHKMYESYRRFLDSYGEAKMGRKSFTQAIRRHGHYTKHHTFTQPVRHNARIVRGVYLESEGKKSKEVWT